MKLFGRILEFKPSVIQYKNEYLSIFLITYFFINLSKSRKFLDIKAPVEILSYAQDKK